MERFRERLAEIKKSIKERMRELRAEENFRKVLAE